MRECLFKVNYVDEDRFNAHLPADRHIKFTRILDDGVGEWVFIYLTDIEATALSLSFIHAPIGLFEVGHYENIPTRTATTRPIL